MDAEWRQVPFDIESASFTDFRALMAQKRSLLGDEEDETATKGANVEGDIFTLCVGVALYTVYIAILFLLLSIRTVHCIVWFV